MSRVKRWSRVRTASIIASMLRPGTAPPLCTSLIRPSTTSPGVSSRNGPALRTVRGVTPKRSVYMRPIASFTTVTADIFGRYLAHW